MEEVLGLLGQNGVIFLIGLIFFMLTYKYSEGLFEWMENQTYGLRDHVMKRLEFLHINVKEEHVTYALVGGSVGVGLITCSLIALMGHFKSAVVVGTIVSIIGWKIPRPIIDYLCEKRIEDYSNQMVDGLNLLSNGLRAGLSVPQSISMVVSEMPAPISQEYDILLRQNKIGSPLEECFEDLARRIPTEDNDMFVTSVNILRETGGKLSRSI